MRGLFLGIACAVGIGIVGAVLIVTWFQSFELPR